ncbi:MAG TPA: type II toxin-antitoxin system PemK/MazF family toxin [Candidatus Acidoferrum sp.]|nr:type II toxin-antitoxin system PemK/MazF family toxin [Candidatus Acidoferrum sp.]
MGIPPTGWYPRRGEVYVVELDKPRPAVVISINELNKFALDVCVVGLTTVQHRNFSVRVPVKKGDGNLSSDCWAKCDQVTTLEKFLFRYPALGALSVQTLARVEEQVRICLGLA